MGTQSISTEWIGEQKAARSSGSGAVRELDRGEREKFWLNLRCMEPLTGRRNFIEICGSGSKFADRNLR